MKATLAEKKKVLKALNKVTGIYLIMKFRKKWFEVF